VLCEVLDSFSPYVLELRLTERDRTVTDSRPCQRDRLPLPTSPNCTSRSGVMCQAYLVKALMCPVVQRPCLAHTLGHLAPAVSVYERPAFGRTSGHMSDTVLSAVYDRSPVFVSGDPLPWDAW